MTSLEIFQLACDLACQYHEGQTYEEDGDYYTNHLLGVSANATRFAPPWLNTYDVQTVGVLHDILEDTECTSEILISKGISKYLVEAVELLSKTTGQSEQGYLENVKKNPLSLCVKIGDSHFNLTNSLIARHKFRVNKYTRYLSILV